MSNPIKIKIKGKESPQNLQADFGDFKVEKSYYLESLRDDAPVVEREADPEDLICLEFEDGVEWIGYLGDSKELKDAYLKRGEEEEELVFANEGYGSSDRGGFGKAILKVIHFLVKPAAKVASKKLVEALDKKNVPVEGLFKVDAQLGLSPVTTQNIDTTKKYLLLLHGLFNHTAGTFGGLQETIWPQVFQQYEGRVLAYEHYTGSKTPLENVIDLLNTLPDGLTLDLLTQSRGGLVAEVLVRCDKRNPLVGYDQIELDLLQNYPEVAKQAKEINQLSQGKQLTIENHVRVACAAGGTLLLSKRIDHFLNFMLNALGLAIGSKLNPLYSVLKEFVVQVVHNKSDYEQMPGLWCQIPGGDYAKLGNARNKFVASKVFMIAGDAQMGGGLGNSLKVLLTNLYYRTDNDLIVNTSSMKQGLVRRGGMFYFLSRSPQTSHFNYFKNQDSAQAVLKALQQKPEGLFQLLSSQDLDRGVQIDLSLKTSLYTKVSGRKPILILIPGIMGSTLSTSEKIWMSITGIAKGGLVKELHIDADNVNPDGIIGMFYDDICQHFLSRYDVYTFAFDWRKSLKEAANLFKEKLLEFQKFNQPIQIVAHSMGGLVVRETIMQHNDVWTSYINKEASKFIMLGTPWGGSYLIMEVLTGHAKKIRQLNMIDRVNLKIEILDTISKYPGVLELLPIDHRDFEKVGFWSKISDIVGHNNMVPPNAALLSHFENYKKERLTYKWKDADFEKIYYIAGHDDTVCDYTEKESIFGGKYIRYKKTSRGDGSVTWDSGIPEMLSREKLYFSEITHGDLANEKIIFEALDDLLKQGKTQKLPQTPSIERTADEITEFDHEDFVASNDNEAFELLFKDKLTSQTKELPNTKIRVSVLNADLKYASYPVMVGHFIDDGLFSAERALDSYLKNKLSERHSVGFYPGAIGESEIVFHKNDQPKGAVVVGMGKQGELTTQLLADSICKALIKYAFFFRDNYEDLNIRKNGSNLSSIMIGSAFAGLPLSDSIKAVILGTQKANKQIKLLNIGLNEIRKIEFVDYYEDVAQQSFAILKRMETQANNYDIIVENFKRGVNSRKKTQFAESNTWWHNFTTEVVREEDKTKSNFEKAKGLTYSSSSGIARVERKHISGDMRLVEELSKAFSHKKEWDKKLSKTMFELLVPNDFKDTIRNQNNIIWRMDEYSAQFPWEMFHDYTTSDEPTFINTGLIRQLLTEEYRQNPEIVSSNKALVIGDPDYSESGFSQLPGAEVEAMAVGDVFEQNKFEVNQLIKAKSHQIINELFSDTYKVMHIAAHGVFDQDRVGVVLGNDLYLSPGLIEQLPTIPEFVFINCCFSGALNDTMDPKYYTNRNKLASNIGPQLIRMGVKAVVVAGWAVDDAAAKRFSMVLYDLMLQGFDFGEATIQARKACYQSNKSSNTWGAYQCYGDHYYKLVNKNPDYNDKKSYVMDSQAIVELENLLSKIKGQKVNIENTRAQLNEIKSLVDDAKLDSANILELYAFILTELGDYEQAIDIFKSLLSKEKASFSVLALEQYCSLRGKFYVRKFKDEKIYDGENLKHLFKDLVIIGLIGKTSERLALIGSANKRAAMIDAKNKKTYLKNMRTCFLDAYKLIKKGPLVDTVYPLSNYLIGNYFLFGLENFKEVKEELQIEAKSFDSFFSGILKEIEKSINTYDDYYKQNAIAKMHMCQLLYGTKKIASVYKDLKESMMKSINTFANMKNILGEMEQLEFITDMLPDGPEKELLLELKGDLSYKMQYIEN